MNLSNTDSVADIWSHPEPKTSRLIIATGVLLTVVLVAIALQQPYALEELESMGYDLMLRERPDKPISKEIVIINIDDKTLEEVGQWPWPRYRFARLLRKLVEADVRGVGIDFIFAEPDNTSIDQIQKDVTKELGIEIDVAHINAKLRDNDFIMAEALAPPRIVSGIWFAFDPPNSNTPMEVPLPSIVTRNELGAPEMLTVPEATKATLPTKMLLKSIQSVGSLNAIPDEDGKIRRTPLLIRYHGDLVPSLALSVVMHTMQKNSLTVNSSQAGIESISVGDMIIPTDHQGNMLLPFRPNTSKQFQYISAVDVIMDRVKPEILRNKLVFLGSSASGLKDLHATPFDRDFPGVQTHAVSAQALLDKEFIQLPAWSNGALVVFTLIAGLFITLLLSHFSLSISTVTGAFLIIGIWYGSLKLFTGSGIYLTPIVPMLTAAVCAIVLSIIRFRSEELRMLRNTRALAAAQNCAILGLVSVAETRDPETGMHIVRTQRYAGELAKHMANKPQFKKVLTPEYIDVIYRSAPLHDIGKVGVPDAVLLKEAKLNEEEFEVMKRHAVQGADVLKKARNTSGIDAGNSFLRCAEEIAGAHHEKWDGTGYPSGTKGENIPISARLMALADVYDALRCNRHYKPPFSHKEARSIIMEGSGTHFDPAVVEAFLELEKKFVSINDEYGDPYVENSSEKECSAEKPSVQENNQQTT